MFAFSDLCVLLDLDHAGAMSIFPTPNEIAAFFRGELVLVALSGDEVVEASGRLRFRTGLNYLYRAPQARLHSTLWRCALEIDGFPVADSSIWMHLSESTSSYLGDTLKREPKRNSRHGYRRYRGDGVIVDLALSPPSQIDADERGQIDLQILHDEPTISMIRRILRLPADARIAGGGLDLPSAWEMRMTVTEVEPEVRIRWSALLCRGENDAPRCSRWLSSFFQDMFGFSTAGPAGPAGERMSIWRLPAQDGKDAATISLHELTDNRRHTGEIRLPMEWRSGPGDG